jgi:hypothetical protein
MADTRARSALTLESSCALSAVGFSERRRQGVRLISGPRREFGLHKTRTFVHVPHPPTEPCWTRRTLTCGVALQYSPSKDRLAAAYPLHEPSPRTLGALTIADGELDAAEMLDLAGALAHSRQPLPTHPLLGRLPLTMPARHVLSTAVRRAYGRMPWTTQHKSPNRMWSVPVGGEGGVRNPNLPPPSRGGIVGADEHERVDLSVVERLIQCAISVRNADDAFHYEPPSTRVLITAERLIACGAGEIEAADAAILALLSSDGAINEGLREVAAASLLGAESSPIKPRRRS